MAKNTAEKADMNVTDCGFINVDIKMLTHVPDIFAISDIAPRVGSI